MYKLVLLFLIPIICFSQSSENDKYEILDYMIFKNKVEQKNTLLFDVRTSKEYNEGHIKGAVNVDFYNESSFIDFFKKIDNTKAIYIYCRSGNRSRKSSDKLIKIGFSKIYDLKDGYVNWKNNQQKEN